MAPPYKLTYFNIMGLGEPIRILLSYGGIDYEDCRVTKEGWPSLKASTPMGQIPTLQFNGKTLHQSVAIGRYVAKKVKLVGANEEEDAEIDAAVDTVNDFRQKIATYFYNDVEGPAKEAYKEKLFKELIPFYLEKLSEIVQTNGGYLVASKLTWADLFLLGLIDYMNHMAGKDLFADSPTLVKWRQTVSEVPTVKAYLVNRVNNHVM